MEDGDTIRFGFIDFTWQLEKVNIVALTSTLNDKEKEHLKKDVTTLGGQIIDQWSDTCTHLVVTNLTFTVKVLQSLCHAIPIVKPEYFRAILSSIRNKGPHPTVEAFEPPITERLHGNAMPLQVNIDRKRLFAGKTFIFMNSRHMEKFQGIIECGMGQCSSLDKKKWQRRSLVNPGFIVISNSTSSTQSQAATQVVSELNDFLRSNGSRMIPDSEISLAILHCSLEKFCNPKHTLKDNFETSLRIVPSTLIANNTPINQNEKAAAITTNSINVPETNEHPHSMAATVTNNSVIHLIDDDDDVMLVEALDNTMKTESTNKGKRKNSTNDEELLSKRPHLEKNVDENVEKSTDENLQKTMKSNENNSMFRIPQHNTRSASKVKNVSTEKPATVIQSVVQEKVKKQDTKTLKSSSNAKKSITPPKSNQYKLADKSSTEISVIEHPASQKRMNSTNSFQAELVTSTQIQPSPRKRIAHRPFSSTISGNDSDSDDGLFKFNNEPVAKKSKPSRGSESDSDDGMNFPQSSGPVAPITTSVPPQLFTQSSQVASDSWLSRPTPSQTFTDITIRTKPKKRNDPVRTPNAINVSAGWQIGQYCISTPPVQIPTQGWCSKDTIKSGNIENEVKQEGSSEKSLFEDSKWMDSIKRGIQVITKSMDLISTSGKVFKVSVFYCRL